MKSVQKSLVYMVIALIILTQFTQDVEARRRVLRGRRVITRVYKQGLAIPGWAIIVLVALCEVLFGLILYFSLGKFVLSPKVEQTSTYQTGMEEKV